MKGDGRLMDVVRGRRSIRQFSEQPVSRDELTELIGAATWAPSAGNRQDWHFTVVTSAVVRDEMLAAVRCRWAAVAEANSGRGYVQEAAAYGARYSDFGGAPVVIAISARAVDAVQQHMLGDDARVTLGSAASAAMAAQNLMLAAHAMGLGTCCMTAPVAARQALARILELGSKREIVCLVAVGRPAELPAAPPRRPVNEVVRFIE